jgi:hypothetical protein
VRNAARWSCKTSASSREPRPVSRRHATGRHPERLPPPSRAGELARRHARVHRLISDAAEATNFVSRTLRTNLPAVPTTCPQDLSARVARPRMFSLQELSAPHDTATLSTPSVPRRCFESPPIGRVCRHFSGHKGCGRVSSALGGEVLCGADSDDRTSRFAGTSLRRSPLTDSNRRPSPYHFGGPATGRNPWQRFWLVRAVFGAIPFATGCHRLRPLCSINAPCLGVHEGNTRRGLG